MENSARNEGTGSFQGERDSRETADDLASGLSRLSVSHPEPDIFEIKRLEPTEISSSQWKVDFENGVDAGPDRVPSYQAIIKHPHGEYTIRLMIWPNGIQKPTKGTEDTEMNMNVQLEALRGDLENYEMKITLTFIAGEGKDKTSVTMNDHLGKKPLKKLTVKKSLDVKKTLEIYVEYKRKKV